MKNKTIGSVIILLSNILLKKVYGIFQGSIEGSISANQVLDNSITYSISNFIASGGLIKVLNISTIIILCIIWIPTIIKLIKKEIKK